MNAFRFQTLLLLMLIGLVIPMRVHGQTDRTALPRFQVQTNLVRYLNLEPNLAFSYRFLRQTTLNLDAGYNFRKEGYGFEDNVIGIRSARQGRPVFINGFGEGYRLRIGVKHYLANTRNLVFFQGFIGYMQIFTKPYSLVRDNDYTIDYCANIWDTYRLGTIAAMYGFHLPFSKNYGMEITAGLGLARGIRTLHVNHYGFGNRTTCTPVDISGVDPSIYEAFAKEGNSTYFSPTVHFGLSLYVGWGE